jgi:hypothetical protein
MVSQRSWVLVDVRLASSNAFLLDNAYVR